MIKASHRELASQSVRYANPIVLNLPILQHSLRNISIDSLECDRAHKGGLKVGMLLRPGETMSLPLGSICQASEAHLELFLYAPRAT